MNQGFRNYLTVTGGYWAFTITDGAIRMLVVLYFHQLGYSPLQIAMLFLFYEFFGIVTNLVGGWLGARIGLNNTMHIGMLMQITALLMLTVPDPWLTVSYVMATQALSGIAKDLNKMSAKAGVKLFLPDQSEATLFRWVAILTGSKNTLKGTGFFIGGTLLAWIGFRDALFALSGMLSVALVVTWMLLPNDLGWSFTQVGTFLALWVIGYGLIQGIAPKMIRAVSRGEPGAGTLVAAAAMLLLIPVAIAVALQQGWNAGAVLIIGLTMFAILFAMNSATHSYLIVSWSDHDKVSMNVGFYYMANAGGRLTGTVLSGLLYQSWGLIGCLYASTAFILAALLLSLPLRDTSKF
ncbi:MAG: MFS transporter [Mariprofundus sp.]